jgi:hypothetical protein
MRKVRSGGPLVITTAGCLSSPDMAMSSTPGRVRFQPGSVVVVSGGFGGDSDARKRLPLVIAERRNGCRPVSEAQGHQFLTEGSTGSFNHRSHDIK